ncbi:hypothetical protein [Streptomyces sp. NPDC058674]|uniref:LppU/SCO3897 family protein n=1 Tax=Streptomyces sp. NPDC058674 TaxID=3346592 RepID=UPI00364BE6C9
MSSQEIDFTLTPEQAAYGVILNATLPTGPARLRIPSCRDGDLVRARVGDQEVLLRIRVAAAQPSGPQPSGPQPSGPQPSGPQPSGPQPSGPPPTGPPPTGPPAPAPAPAASSRTGCLVAAGVVAAVIVGFFLIGSGDDTDGKASASSTRTPSADSPSPYPSYSPSYSPSYAPAYPTADAATEPATTAPTSAAPSPYDKGTCLNGTLPDSTTPQRVNDVDEVPCSASDAHYRVIESIPFTSDMNRCDAYPKTEYAFSYRYTLNGSVINQYVYCLVGLGSYAR